MKDPDLYGEETVSCHDWTNASVCLGFKVKTMVIQQNKGAKFDVLITSYLISIIEGFYWTYTMRVGVCVYL